MKDFIKKIKRILRRAFKRENVMRALVIISGTAMILATILPYILR